MEETYYNVNEAYELLKEKIALYDLKGNHFLYKKSSIRINNSNASYTLSKEDFLKLYEKSKFYIKEDKDAIIDTLKDEEYYGFKHK